MQWPDLLKSAVFDEWIANEDRLPNNMAIAFGFLSDTYAAQFDAVPDSSRIQQALVRAQSKL